MKTFRLLLLACCAVLAGWPGVSRGDDSRLGLSSEESAASEPVATVACEDFSEVTCTGTNPALVSDIVQLAADSRDSLSSLLKLGKDWRYPVHITLLDPTPGAAPPRESSSIITDGKTLRIEAFLPSDDLNAREFVQRQFVTAMLWEKYFAPDATFTAQTRLDVVPLWLIEGLREWLNDDPERNRDEIVKRAALAQRTPTLKEITGWTDLSPDRLLGLWQRAFCYYLVESLVNKPSRRADFQGWLASVAGRNPQPAAWLFPTEMGWQRELLQADTRSRGLVYTWDESAAELTATETIALPKGKDAADTRLCTIDTVAKFPLTPEIEQAINAKILDLTALQLRVHPGWQRIFQLYRFGLTALVRDKNVPLATQFLHEAHVQRAAEVELHQDLVDYANWFEVTQNMPIEASHFRSYFQVARQVDTVQADPAHPNPMRAGLLNVESKF